VADEPYAIAQDVASAIRLFTGEAYYDTTRGVPHFQTILGRQPPLSVLKATLVKAAKTVPQVANAAVFISAVSDRTVSGQVQVTTSAGATLAVAGNLNSPTPL
jgi:hypothetical protein